jgi:hypothetical protein
LEKSVSSILVHSAALMVKLTVLQANSTAGMSLSYSAGNAFRYSSLRHNVPSALDSFQAADGYFWLNVDQRDACSDQLTSAVEQKEYIDLFDEQKLRPTLKIKSILDLWKMVFRGRDWGGVSRALNLFSYKRFEL